MEEQLSNIPEVVREGTPAVKPTLEYIANKAEKTGILDLLRAKLLPWSAKSENLVILEDAATDRIASWIDSENPVELAMGVEAASLVRKGANVIVALNEAVGYTKLEKIAQVNDDLFATWFDHVGRIFDSDMRTIWARILAGEADSPGSVSKGTLNVLADLDSTDANYFSMLSVSFATITVKATYGSQLDKELIPFQLDDAA